MYFSRTDTVSDQQTEKSAKKNKKKKKPKKSGVPEPAESNPEVIDLCV